MSYTPDYAAGLVNPILSVSNPLLLYWKSQQWQQYTIIQRLYCWTDKFWPTSVYTHCCWANLNINSVLYTRLIFGWYLLPLQLLRQVLQERRVQQGLPPQCLNKYLNFQKKISIYFSVFIRIYFKDNNVCHFRNFQQYKPLLLGLPHHLGLQCHMFHRLELIHSLQVSCL